MKWFIVVALVGVVTVLPACRGTQSGHVAGTGTIRSDGGKCSGWHLSADSGDYYELTSLDEAYQQDGLRVRFNLRKRDDMASICMRGPIADVVAIKRL